MTTSEGKSATLCSFSPKSSLLIAFSTSSALLSTFSTSSSLFLFLSFSSSAISLLSTLKVLMLLYSCSKVAIIIFSSSLVVVMIVAASSHVITSSLIWGGDGDMLSSDKSSSLYGVMKTSIIWAGLVMFILWLLPASYYAISNSYASLLKNFALICSLLNWKIMSLWNGIECPRSWSASGKGSSIMNRSIFRTLSLVKL